jgi:GTP-binding protein
MKTRFILSAASVDTMPKHAMAEIAFVGRSNVGKSSLINAVSGSKIARTSKTPGRTQLINFFEVSSARAAYVLADLPGYGYAKAPGPVREQWRRLIGRYLEARESLSAVLLLFDMRREVAGEDRAFHALLVHTVGARGAAVWVVGTKSDQLSKAHIRPRCVELERALGTERVFVTSASKKVGVDELRREIEALAAGHARRGGSGKRPY